MRTTVKTGYSLLVSLCLTLLITVTILDVNLAHIFDDEKMRSSTISVASLDNVKSVTSLPWPDMGDMNLPSHNGANKNNTQVYINTEEDIVEDLFYILLVRVVAIFSSRDHGTSNGRKYFRASEIDVNIVNKLVPPRVFQELHEYVQLIVSKYREVHYHSFFHAYHVVVSTNKLLDMCLNDQRKKEGVATFGIRSNPLLQLALIFSALIHDVDHQGITNLQLVDEEDELAILYNDQSVAEQQSLAIAFRTLAQPEFATLKKSLFPDTKDYRFFRKTVIDLVLSTDISSPERTQIAKSKWKEAFGETPEVKAYKKIMESEIQQSIQSINSNPEGVGHQRRNRINSFLGRRSFKVAMNNGLHQNRHANEEDDFFAKAGPESDNEFFSMSPCGSSDEDDDEDSSVHAQTYRVPSLGSERNIVEKKGSGIEHEKDSRHVSQLTNDSFMTYNSDDFDDSEEISESDGSPDNSKGQTKSADNKPHDSHVSRKQNTNQSKDIESDFKPTTSSGEDDLNRSEQSKGKRKVDMNDVPKIRSKSESVLKFSRRRSNDSLSQIDFSLHRRCSAPITSKEHFRQRSSIRLGIRRALDLTGNSIEQYAPSPHEVILNNGKVAEIKIADDEPDEFRAAVVLETMLRAADISANMQTWKTYLKWSSRFFFEQMAAFESNRLPVNPVTNWFENQITFLDVVVIPLAKRLGDTGVFGDEGQQFAAFAQENRRQWVLEGKEFTEWMTRRWRKVKEKGNS